MAELKDFVEAMSESNTLRDAYVDREMDKLQERATRQREDITRDRRDAHERVDALAEWNTMFTAQLESMVPRLCHCGEKSPSLRGEGSADVPFELEDDALEYAEDEDYHTPPTENSTPIPVAPPCCADSVPVPGPVEVHLSSMSRILTTDERYIRSWFQWRMMRPLKRLNRRWRNGSSSRTWYVEDNVPGRLSHSRIVKLIVWR